MKPNPLIILIIYLGLKIIANNTQVCNFTTLFWAKSLQLKLWLFHRAVAIIFCRFTRVQYFAWPLSCYHFLTR